MRRGFTLIELLVIVTILATMVTIGVGVISSGQGAARVKGATRDIYAAIRHARSTALVTGQPAIITYSTVVEDGEVMAKIEVHSAKLFETPTDLSAVETLSGEPIKGADRELVHIEKAGGDAVDDTKPLAEGKSPEDGSAGKGETIEEILFAPINAEIVKGMRLKAVKGDELESSGATPVRKSRISVFSNVDYLIGKFESAKAEEKKKSAEAAGSEGKAAGAAAGKPSSGEEPGEPLSVVWETNGRVDPHQVWVYSDGQRPEDGLLIKVDRFGAAKVLPGDGRGEE